MPNMTADVLGQHVRRVQNLIADANYAAARLDEAGLTYSAAVVRSLVPVLAETERDLTEVPTTPTH